MRWLDPGRLPQVVRGGQSCPPRKSAATLRAHGVLVLQRHLTPCAVGLRTHRAGGALRRPANACARRVRRPAALRGAVVLVTLVLAAAGCSSPGGDQILAPERGPWHRTGPVASYTADNLHEYIDGAAPFVVSFGFKLLKTATYRRGAETETTVDIYDMGSGDNAFALFRSNSNVEAGPLEVGAEGAGADARIEFWQGPCYVVVSNPTAGEKDEVLALARDLAQALPPGKALPAYLDLLPTTGRVVHSEKYTPSDYLGHEFLGRTVSARYKAGDREVTLFACRCDASTGAAAAMGRLKTFLEKRSPAQALTRGEGGFVAADSTLGRIAVFQRGQFVAGLYPYEDDPAADNLLADLDRRLGAK